MATPLDPTDDLERSLAAAARQVRGGSALLPALVAADRQHPTNLLGRVLSGVEAGATLRATCESLLRNDRRPRSDHVLVLHTIALSSRFGGDVAANLDAVVDTLRDQRIVADERRAAASTALASTRVLTWLPVICGAYLAVDDPSVRHVLLGSPIGWACLVTGSALNVIGRRWSASLVRRIGA